jgi:acid phosphatase family membrane protein YuiD
MVGAKGRQRALQLAVEAEKERTLEEERLLADLGRPASHSEQILVEQLTTLIVRSRRLRKSGRFAQAEMVARLIMRGLAKLGIRQAAAKLAETPAEFLARIAAERTSATNIATENVRTGGAS